MVRFRFSEYLGNIPIFFQTKFSTPQLKTFSVFLKSRPTRSTDSLHKRINTDDIVILYRYCFLLYIIEYGIEIDINILVVTISNIDSAELFTLFICAAFSLSSHPHFTVISNAGLILFYLLRVISTSGQRFFHLNLVSYQDRLRNPK